VGARADPVGAFECGAEGVRAAVADFFGHRGEANGSGARRRVFVTVFIGIAVACGLLIVMSLLKRLDPQSASSVSFWSSYVSDWTTWNHVRALGPIIAVVLLVLSLRRG
jgi:uncharacterized membrane protein